MAEFFFTKWNILILVLFLQLELFSTLCYDYYVFFSKSLQNGKNQQSTKNVTLFSSNQLMLYILTASVIFMKTSTPLNYVYIYIIFFIIVKLNKFFFFKTTSGKDGVNYLQLLLFTTISTVSLLIFVDSFLTLFFFLELIAVLYYFAFLTNYKQSSQVLLKYKNGLMILLWNNFLTTFFLGFGCFFIIQKYGTSNFLELSFIATSCNYVYIYLLGVFWKLGLPLFHFLKMEVYKYLLKENVFYFALITTVINIVILMFCLSQIIIYTTLYLHNMLVIIFCFFVMFIVSNINLSSILYFFAISSIITLSTALSLFLL